MSTNKTQNYQLHSWVPEDEFHVAEINENFTKLDTALKTEAQTAAAERSSLNTALRSEAATRAQQIAAKADASAVTSLQSAVNARIRMVVGTYTGNSIVNGATPQHIQLGFRPKAIFIGYERGFADSLSNPYGGLATAACNMSGAVTLDDTGFTVVNVYSEQLRPNLQGMPYCYAAFY